MRHAFALSLLLALAPVVAGCLGEPDAPEAVSAAAAAGPAAGASAAGALSDATPGSSGLPAGVLAFPRAPPPKTLWLNGSFQFHQQNYPLGIATGPVGAQGDNPRRTDISADVPKGVPVRLVAEVNAAFAEGDVDIWFEVPEGENWAAWANAPRGGFTRFEMILAHTSSEPVNVVIAYDEAAPAAAFDYALRVDVIPFVDTLPGGLPVGVSLAPGDSVTVTRMDATAPATLLVFEPNDRLALRVDAPADDAPAFTLPPGAPAGEYVLMIAEGGTDVRLNVTGPSAATARPRLLKQAIVEGPPVPLATTGATWTVDSRRAPLQVVVLIDFPGAAADYEATVASPAGPVFAFGITGDPIVHARHGWGTDMGAENLVAGAYTFTITTTAAAHVSAWEIMVYYAR